MNNLIVAGYYVYNYCGNLTERAVIRGSELYEKYTPSSFLLGKRSVIVLTGLALSTGIVIIYRFATSNFKNKSKVSNQEPDKVILPPTPLTDILVKYHKKSEIDGPTFDLEKLVHDLDANKIQQPDVLFLALFKNITTNLDPFPVFNQFLLFSKIGDIKAKLIEKLVEKFYIGIDKEKTIYNKRIDQFTDRFDINHKKLELSIIDKLKNAISEFAQDFILTFVTSQERKDAIMKMEIEFSENKEFLSLILREFYIRAAIFSLSNFCIQNGNEGGNIIVELNIEQLNECLKECVELLQMELTEQQKVELNQYFDQITSLINEQTHDIHKLKDLSSSFHLLAKILGSTNEIVIEMNTDEDDQIAKQKQFEEDEIIAMQLQYDNLNYIDNY